MAEVGAAMQDKKHGVCDPSSPYYDANACMIQTQHWMDEQSLEAIEHGLQPWSSEPEIIPDAPIDAFGIRLEGSGWALGSGGVDVNLDFVYFSNSHEFSIFITPGYEQGLGGGFALTGGFLFGSNFPNKSAYSGPAATIMGFDAPIPFFGINVEGDFSLGTPNPDGTIPDVTYLGAGPLQPEAGGYVVGGFTFDLLGFLP